MVERGPYQVLVVDPPWAYGADTGRPNRTAEAHYKTIGRKGKEINRRSGAGIEDIIASVPISEWAAPESHLYLWTTNPKLPFAFAVMEAWGFTYKTMLTWVKTRADGGVSGGGMGWFFRGATEHVLFGTRGGLGIPSAMRKPNVVLAPTTTHSSKPDAFYSLIDGIYQEGTTKLDVFARRRRAGWDAYGDELDKHLRDDDLLAQGAARQVLVAQLADQGGLELLDSKGEGEAEFGFGEEAHGRPHIRKSSAAHRRSPFCGK